MCVHSKPWARRTTSCIQRTRTHLWDAYKSHEPKPLNENSNNYSHTAANLLTRIKYETCDTFRCELLHTGLASTKTNEIRHDICDNAIFQLRKMRQRCDVTPLSHFVCQILCYFFVCVTESDTPWTKFLGGLSNTQKHSKNGLSRARLLRSHFGLKLN